ncbi:MAG: radical SAM protein [Pseudomonadota bacterium]|nr:radical SAM protein [Pseudomonadota bacterium]MDP1904452.1 radical SAM protein [Pseudomonadota bacterium]MDP2351384.1 radical SAM protein [Pseudomonadota bacterium]
MPVLDTRNHDRAAAGLTYVYPVLSRRAGGVSVGVNLNPNNACNWRCIYCQVPELTRGGPPSIDLMLLEYELRGMLSAIVHGDFMASQVPEALRRLNDVALSGNGEPTSAPEFPAVVELIGRVLADFGLLGEIKIVLISNGSLATKPYVQAGLTTLSGLAGEVWFKFDRATRAGLRQVNDTECDPERHYQRLKIVAGLCPTWMQTCMFAVDGNAPSTEEVEAWLALLARCVKEEVPLRGVLLYGLARASAQPEAARLTALPEAWLRALARRVEDMGLAVKISV